MMYTPKILVGAMALIGLSSCGDAPSVPSTSPGEVYTVDTTTPVAIVDDGSEDTYRDAGSFPTSRTLLTKMIPQGTLLCEERMAYDLCADVQFDFGYNTGTLPGIDNIIFTDTTEDTCGYLGTRQGGIIGFQKKWVVSEIHGEALAVENLLEKIGNDKVINEVYLLDPTGGPGSIITEMWNTADRVKIHLNETYDGNSGVDRLFGNGILWMNVTAYGETRSVSTSREHTIAIQNPTLMPLTLPSLLLDDRIISEQCIEVENTICVGD